MGKIQDFSINHFASDHWKSYEDFMPSAKHLQTKSETYTVEGYNSIIRHYLSRFKRKAKCYSKAEYMIDVSLNLLFLKPNNTLISSNLQYISLYPHPFAYNFPVYKLVLQD